MVLIIVVFRRWRLIVTLVFIFRVRGVVTLLVVFRARGILVLVLWSLLKWGAPWATGYRPSNEDSGFFGPWTVSHILQYLAYLPQFGLGPAFGLGLLGASLLCLTPHTRWLGISSLGASLIALVIFGFYYWAPPMDPQITLRFFTPLLPLYAVCAAALLDKLSSELHPAAKAALATPVVLWQLGWGYQQVQVHLVATGYAKRLVHESALAVNKVVPENSLLVADHQLLQFLEYLQRWRLISPRSLGPKPPEQVTSAEGALPYQLARDDYRLAPFRTGSDRERIASIQRELLRLGARDIYLVRSGGNPKLDVRLVTNCSPLQAVELPEVPSWPEPEGVLGAAAKPRPLPRKGDPWTDELRAKLPLGVGLWFDLNRVDPRLPLIIEHCRLRL